MKFPAAALAASSLVVTTVQSRHTVGSPVEKVVNLLKKLQTNLDQDQENEQKVYDKYACWCDTSLKLKANAIDQARVDIRALSQEIFTLKGHIATLESEIQEHEAAIAENVKLQADATALRQKENGEFMADTSEMKQALAAMQDAVHVLIEGSGGAAMLQQGTAAATVRRVLDVLPLRASGSDKTVSLLADFAQAGSEAKFAPQSLTIQGILKDLYDTYSTDLEAATSTEAIRNRDYETYIKEKQEENASLEAAKKSREEQKAEAEQSLADATALYDETDKQMSADTDFFDATKAGCLLKSDEWTLRKSLRTEEIDGIKKALEILTSDSAREMFASAIKAGKETGGDGTSGQSVAPPSFLQTENVDTLSAPASKAYTLLKANAVKGHSLRLAQLAVQVREAKVGHFEAVIQAIDNMIQTLKNENQADISKRDQCKAEYLDADSTIKQLTWEIEKNTAKIDKLDSVIAEHEEEKAQTIQAISDTNAQIAAMIAQREAENTAFLHAKSEDEAAIALLHSAKDALEKFYKEHGLELGNVQAGVKDAAFLQQGPDFEVSQWQAPDAGFKDAGARKGESKGIVSIMTYLIEDLNDEVYNGKVNEQKTQVEFEKAKAAAEKLVADLTAKKVSLETAIAARQDDKAAEQGVKANNEALLNDEVTYRNGITPDCDWIIGAFEKRAARRTAEMNGLTGAKDFLAGSSEAALVQQHNDMELSSIRFASLRR